MKDKIDCIWLNKNFGKGYWICNGKLHPTNPEICMRCQKEEKENQKKLEMIFNDMQ